MRNGDTSRDGNAYTGPVQGTWRACDRQARYRVLSSQCSCGGAPQDDATQCNLGRRDIAGRNDLSTLMLSGECDWIVSDYSQRIVTNAVFIKLDTVEPASRLKLLNISCCSGSYLAFMLAL